MSLEPNENLRLRSDYPDYSKPIGDGIAQALQDYASAHRLTMENISLRQQLEMAEACLAGDAALITGLKSDIADKDAEIATLRQQVLSSDAQALEHYQQLGASQLREQQLREALTVGWSPYYINGIDARKMAEEALALPTDTSALEAMIQRAGEVAKEQAAIAATKAWHRSTCYIYDITDAIRTLPSVKLEDLK